MEARGERNTRSTSPGELETQSGARIDVSGLRGKWLLVDFIRPNGCAIFTCSKISNVSVSGS